MLATEVRRGLKEKQTALSKVVTGGRTAMGNRAELPKGSTVFQKVLQEIYKEMEEEKHVQNTIDEDDDIVKNIKEPGRPRVQSFRRTASVSGGHSGAFVRMPSRKLLLKTKSSRELLLEHIAIES